MTDPGKTITLKDGNILTIRLMSPEDKEKLLTFFEGLPPEDRIYLRRDVADPRVIEQIIHESQQPNSTWVVAEKDGRIVGEGTLSHPTHGWLRKTGELRLLVARDLRNMGVGAILTRELFKWAVKMELDKVVAYAAEEQETAIRCVEKLGFVKEAVLSNYIMDTKNHLHNMVVLSLQV